MNIYLIRHGRQNSKLCNVDVELSKEGREQAALVGKRLAKYNIDVVYSSQLIRAVETADIINEYENMIDEKDYSVEILEQAIVYDDIYKQPSRKKCALLPWWGIEKIIKENSD